MAAYIEFEHVLYCLICHQNCPANIIIMWQILMSLIVGSGKNLEKANVSACLLSHSHCTVNVVPPYLCITGNSRVARLVGTRRRTPENRTRAIGTIFTFAPRGF